MSDYTETCEMCKDEFDPFVEGGVDENDTIVCEQCFNAAVLMQNHLFTVVHSDKYLH
jgi:hypothetical protein